MAKAKSTRLKLRKNEETVLLKGRPRLKASVVTSTPLPSNTEESVSTTARPERVHKTVVSIKALTMVTRPPKTGSRVLVAAAPIAEDPKPASLENIPFENPTVNADLTVIPTAAPFKEDTEKADLTIWNNAFGTKEMLLKIIIQARAI